MKAPKATRSATLERLVQRLRDTAPAADPAAAAKALLPPTVAAALFPGALTAAAVLVPLIERPEGLTVLLTRRTEHLRDHPGQISLPGGRLDSPQESPLAAALREAHEELGIRPELVEVAGYLPPHAVVTGFVVTPVVGILPPALELRLDTYEVAEAFEVPLAFLLEPRNRVESVRRLREVEFPTWEYTYSNHRIWGATAHILNSLIDQLNYKQ